MKGAGADLPPALRGLPERFSGRRPILIAGPTASGKSALGLALAERFGGTVINADALQVYANWRILTARPSAEEEARVPHRLYGHVAADDPYSVGRWLRELAPLLEGPRLPIILGGTGLYFSALTEGLAEIPPVPEAIRQEALARIGREGAGALLAELDAEDPETAARIDRRNPMRIQRAWEVLRATGRPLASWHRETPPPLLPLARAEALLLMPGRDWLAARIARRFDAMLAAGALEEARANLPGWRADLPSAKAIGAAALIAHLRGEITLEAARESAITATRQYAKRQRSWFRARMAAWPAVSLPDGREMPGPAPG